MNKREVFESLRRSHEEFLTAINQFSNEEMTTRPIVGDWTPKDLLAHVTRWENVCSGYLVHVAVGEAIPPLEATSNDLNARWSAQDRNLTLDEVWQNCDESALRIRAMVESLEDKVLDQPMRGLDPEDDELLPLWRIISFDTWDHYQQHIKDIEKATGKAQ
jgi:hypothetical protein